MSTRIGATLFATSILLAVSPAWGWDTLTVTHDGGDPVSEWKSIYMGPGASMDNEHTAISDRTFGELGTGRFRSDDPNPMLTRAVDLNASLYRRGKIGNSTRGDVPETALEERDLPAPGNFAGLPDYSYTLYDWLNKNQLCPSVPESAEDYEKCHVYHGWLGSLNANHFGSQARATYDRLHGIAVMHAGEAKALRETLAQTPGAEEAYADHILEREYLALAYEGVAQHFLQDRHSSGHMWERWSTSDYEDLVTNETRSLGDAFFVAAAAGALHGHESVSKLPDAMCSPVIDESVLDALDGIPFTPVEWTPDDTNYYPGIGDYRFSNALDRTYQGFALEVDEQTDRLLTCGARSWDEVIRAFGAVEPGVFGAHKVRLTRTFSPEDEARCLADGWATNQAMWDGWTNGVPVTAVNALISAGTGNGRQFVKFNRKSLSRIYWRLALARVANPRGTDIARGRIGALATGRPGNQAQQVAGHIEPADWSNLPKRADTFGLGMYPGLDKDTLHGFFNRAFAAEFCDDPEDYLTPLRGSDDPADREACALLADRLHRGTEPGASSPVSETRMHAGQPIEPLCALVAGASPGADTESGITDREEYPYFLHPGYVAEPGKRADHGFSADSVANWCDQVPILDTDDAGVAATADTNGGEVVVEGLNLSDVVQFKAGDVVLPIARKFSTELQLTAPSGVLPVGRYPITMIARRGPNRRQVDSVGTFYLDVREGDDTPVCEPLNQTPPFVAARCPGAGQVTVNSQADIDALDTDCFGGVLSLEAGLASVAPGSLPATIDYHLQVVGADMEVLDLTGVEHIGGVLRIVANPNLRRVVAPDLRHAARIEINGNNLLEEVDLGGDFCVNNDIIVERSPALTDLGLDGLRRVTGIRVFDLPRLATVSAANLETVGTPRDDISVPYKFVQLQKLPSLLSIDFSSLREAHSGFTVEETNIPSIVLPSLEHARSFRIANNPELATLSMDALGSLGSVRQYANAFIVRGNGKLDSETVAPIPTRVCRAGGYVDEGFATIRVCANGGTCQARIINNGEEEFMEVNSCGLADCGHDPCNCIYGAYPPCGP